MYNFLRVVEKYSTYTHLCFAAVHFMHSITLYGMPLILLSLNQVQHDGQMSSNYDYFRSNGCLSDWLRILDKNYCGGFKKAFLPGSPLYDNANELPYSLVINVAGRSRVDFHFFSDYSGQFSGFLFHWRLD